MDSTDPPVVKRPLSYWILSANRRIQIMLVLVIGVTVLLRVIPLEMQKRVVNEAIALRRVDLLLRYCGIYLVAVLSASGMKYLINYLQTRIGEQTLEAVRRQLYAHIITLPMHFFRRTQPGMVVSSLITEVAAIGEFAAMALAVPITSILTLVAFAIYLLWLNPLLAVISMGIYPLALILVPLLQRRANRANSKRVDRTRDLSDCIAESVSGIHEIQGNGAFLIENKKFSKQLRRLRKVRVVWRLYRYAVKVSNNFFTNLSPFLIFIVGGYLTMQGRLEIGALVAFLSAQEKLYDPWRELIDFYQVYQDAKVRYRRIMDAYDVALDHRMEPDKRMALQLENRVQLQNLSLVTESGVTLLNNVNLTLSPGEHMALVGFSGSGKSTLAQCIIQLHKHTGGQLLLGGEEITALTKRDVVNNVGFVSQSPFIFSGSIDDNLLYALRARKGANANGHAEDAPSLDRKLSVLQQTGIFVDVLRFGLNTILNPETDADLIPVVIRLRSEFQSQFGESLDAYLEFFDPEKYLVHASVAENLFLGAARDDRFEMDGLAGNTYFVQFLKDTDLMLPLISLGADLARQTVAILGNIEPDNLFFQKIPMRPDELEDYRQVVEQIKNNRLLTAPKKHQLKLLHLALRFNAGLHKLVVLPDFLQQLILEGRAHFQQKVKKDYPNAFSFYDQKEYLPTLSILNNVIFGRSTTDNPIAQEKINQSMIQLLIEEDLLERVAGIGLRFDVGSKGERLSGGQRQKLAIARTLLKEPSVLIMDEATSALDNKSQSRIQNLLDKRWKGKTTLISVVHRLDIIKNYDKIAVMKSGKIVEIGTYDELMQRKGMLYELVGE